MTSQNVLVFHKALPQFTASHLTEANSLQAFKVQNYRKQNNKVLEERQEEKW